MDRGAWWSLNGGITTQTSTAQKILINYTNSLGYGGKRWSLGSSWFSGKPVFLFVCLHFFAHHNAVTMTQVTDIGRKISIKLWKYSTCNVWPVGYEILGKIISFLRGFRPFVSRSFEHPLLEFIQLLLNVVVKMFLLLYVCFPGGLNPSPAAKLMLPQW